MAILLDAVVFALKSTRARFVDVTPITVPTEKSVPDADNRVATPDRSVAALRVEAIGKLNETTEAVAEAVVQTTRL